MTSTRPEIGTSVEVLLTDARGAWTAATVVASHPYFTPDDAVRVVTATGTDFDVLTTNVRPAPVITASAVVPPCMVCGVPSEWDTAAGAVCSDHCDEL